ncbi:MAG: phosphoribosylglycinamide formyltransferase [Deltaproteobacteria bacterium]|nr:phosphoribosylglycinamide formyltransferase [Deltaproteobacteria bacterium]
MGLRLGWFSTGRDEAARNLLQTVHDDLKACAAPAAIEWIFCHREIGDGPENEESRERRLFFGLADKLGIPMKTFSHVRFMPELRKKGLAQSSSAAEASADLERWRDLFGEEVVRVVDRDPVDVVVMAGYMLIIGEPELRRLNLVNIHPALPWGPRGTWQEVILQLIAEEADEQGIMVHLVTKTLDRGPVISYCRFPIRGEGWEHLWEQWRRDITADASREERESHSLFRKIREVGEVRELPLLSCAIRELAFGRIRIHNKTIWAHGKPQDQGVDLTDHIEDCVGQSA